MLLTKAGRAGVIAAIPAAVAVLGFASPALAATPVITVDPTAVQTAPGNAIVTGTYRCDPQYTGRITVQLTQGSPVTRASQGLISTVPCDGTVHTYSVTTAGSIARGPAQYHTVLTLIGSPAASAKADGTLTVI
jgi:hypothetical protein